MNKIILFQTLVVLASAEVPAGDHSSTANQSQLAHTVPIVTQGINPWANTNAMPAITNSPATNLPAMKQGPSTHQPAILGAPTGLAAQVH